MRLYVLFQGLTHSSKEDVRDLAAQLFAFIAVYSDNPLLPTLQTLKANLSHQVKHFSATIICAEYTVYPL